MKHSIIWSMVTMLLIVTGISITTEGQEPQQAVTIALPTFVEAIVDEAIVDDFEAQTGVEVKFIYDAAPPGANDAPRTSDDVEAYAEEVEDYASSADVLFVDDFLVPEITRAGYVLDLTPLVSADNAMNPGDFYSAVWESFMWDGGMWAVPVAAQPLLVDYNIDAFDEAGLAYPTTSWTIDDFAFAARELTEYDETGEVTLPGMQVSTVERNALFRALLGRSYYDDFAFPSTPMINDSDLAVLLETWEELVEDGVVFVGGAGGFAGQNNSIGIQFSSGGDFAVFFTDEDGNQTDAGPANDDNEEAPNRTIAPMPDGNSALLGSGLAISSGTMIPELAYQLVTYLSQQLAFADIAIGSEPARREYFTGSLESGALVFNFGENRTPEEIEIVQNALDTGLPMSELRFSQYVASAFSKVQSGTLATDALQEAEIEAFETLETIDALEVAMTVTAGLPLSVTEGEVVLTFGIQSFVQPLPNEADWDEAIADFVANDPDVGAIDLDLINLATALLGGGDTETYDCTYYPNTLFADIDDELLLALDPLLSTDPNYNIFDLPAGTLPLTQLNGITYGLPITIQPQMLNYDPEAFAQAGIPEPLGGWTISEFGDALNALKNVVDEDTAPFTAPGFDNTYLLMLTAAQGGLPFDTSTFPPGVDFTSPEVVTATQLILEWVDEGLIDQGQAPGGGGFAAIGEVNAPVTPTLFGGFSNPDLSVTSYPTGTAYTPVAFDVGAGYISIDSDVPQACFRWLSFISRQPELFTGAMPAQISLLERPEVQESLGDDAIAAYRTIATQMNAPNVVNFNATDPFVTTWLIRAFETYLASDIELLPELQDAELYTNDYLACTQSIEFEISIRLFQQLTECVENVDSAIIE